MKIASTVLSLLAAASAAEQAPTLRASAARRPGPPPYFHDYVSCLEASAEKPTDAALAAAVDNCIRDVEAASGVIIADKDGVVECVAECKTSVEEASDPEQETDLCYPRCAETSFFIEAIH